MKFGDPIVGGTTLVREAIQSPNYVANVSGWRIARDGSVEFGSGLFRGTLNIANNFIVDATGKMQSRTTSGTPRMELLDAGTAPFQWPQLYVDPSGVNGSRSVFFTTGKATALSRAASLNLQSADATPISATATLEATVIRLFASPAASRISFTGSTVNLADGGNRLDVSGGAVVTATRFVSDGALGNSASAGVTVNNGKAYVELSAGTGGDWSQQNIVASSPSGNAGVALRTAPVAAQIRLGTANNDLYFRNSVDSAFITLQAAAFTVGSRLDTKRNVEPLPHDALGLVRAMRPVRYRQDVAEPEMADSHHLLSPALRGRTPVATMRRWRETWEQSTTHLGLVVDELAELCPDLIHPGEDGRPAGYSLSGLLALVVGAVQALAQDLEDLRGTDGP